MAKTTRKTTTRKTTKTPKPAVKQEESQTTEVTDKQGEVPEPVEVSHPKAPELPKGKRKSSGVDQKKRPVEGGSK